MNCLIDAQAKIKFASSNFAKSLEPRPLVICFSNLSVSPKISMWAPEGNLSWDIVGSSNDFWSCLLTSKLIIHFTLQSLSTFETPPFQFLKFTREPKCLSPLISVSNLLEWIPFKSISCSSDKHLTSIIDSTHQDFDQKFRVITPEDDDIIFLFTCNGLKADFLLYL